MIVATLVTYHIKVKISKAGIIKKLNKALPHHSLITICKSFVRPRVDYGGMSNQIIRKLKEFNTILLLE